MITFDVFGVTHCKFNTFIELLAKALKEHTTDVSPSHPKEYRILKLEIMKTGEIDSFGNYEDYSAIIIIASAYKELKPKS